MSLFGRIVRTAVNVAVLPVAVVKDVVTIGGTLNDKRKPYTTKQLERIKDEAEDLP